MKNHNKEDKLYKNYIIPPNTTKPVSSESVGNAQDKQACIYNHQRHAVGSVIKNEDGSESICEKDGTWRNNTQKSDS